jgi:hypothetical protein
MVFCSWNVSSLCGVACSVFAEVRYNDGPGLRIGR